MRTADDGTGEVSSGRSTTASVTDGISCEVKSEGKPDEKLEEAIVLLTSETTQLAVREGPLLQQGQAGRYVTVHDLWANHTINTSQERERRLGLSAKRSKAASLA